MKKKVIVIGRTWKFVEFLIPTIESILKFNNRNEMSIVVLENKSTRTDIIEDYCIRMLRDKNIDGYVQSNRNVFEDIGRTTETFLDFIKQHEYMILTDLDIKVDNIENWIDKLICVMNGGQNIGTVSIDFHPMMPYSSGFQYIEDFKMKEKDFWEMPTDSLFSLVRTQDYINFVEGGGNGKFGNGGMNSYLTSIGKKMGRTNIKGYHYGWLRMSDEYKYSYAESIGKQLTEKDNHLYCDHQHKDYGIDLKDFKYFGNIYNHSVTTIPITI